MHVFDIYIFKQDKGCDEDNGSDENELSPSEMNTQSEGRKRRQMDMKEEEEAKGKKKRKAEDGRSIHDCADDIQTITHLLPTFPFVSFTFIMFCII